MEVLVRPRCGVRLTAMAMASAAKATACAALASVALTANIMWHVLTTVLYMGNASMTSVSVICNGLVLIVHECSNAPTTAQTTATAPGGHVCVTKGMEWQIAQSNLAVTKSATTGCALAKTVCAIWGIPVKTAAKRHLHALPAPVAVTVSVTTPSFVFVTKITMETLATKS